MTLVARPEAYLVRPHMEPMANVTPQTILECPEWLPHEAKLEWDRIIGQLDETKILSRLDEPALAAYCVAYTQYKSACKLAEEGLFVERPQGLIENPALKIQERLAVKLLQFASQFGLTPKGRQAMKVPRKTSKAEDDFDKFTDTEPS